MIPRNKEIFIDFFFGYYRNKKNVSCLLKKIDSLLIKANLGRKIYLRVKYKLLLDRLILYIKTEDFFRHIRYKVMRFFRSSSYLKYAYKNLFRILFLDKVFYYKNRLIIKEKRVIFTEVNDLIFDSLKGLFKRRYLFDESNHEKILNFLKKKYGVNFFTIINDNFNSRRTNFCFFLKDNLYSKNYLDSVAEYKESISGYLRKKKEIFFFFKNPKNIKRLLNFITLNKISIFKYKFKKKKISNKLLKKEYKKQKGKLFFKKKDGLLFLKILEKKDASLNEKTSFFLKKKILSVILSKK